MYAAAVNYAKICYINSFTIKCFEGVSVGTCLGICVHCGFIVSIKKPTGMERIYESSVNILGPVRSSVYNI